MMPKPSYSVGQHGPKRSSLSALAVLGLSWCALAASDQDAASSLKEPAPKPNLLIILADDWAHSDLLAARMDDSPWNDLPVIDALAARGQSWNHFYSQPLCNQTRQTLIFGKYIGGVSDKTCGPTTKRTPPASSLTIASNLKSAGYQTAAFGKWHVGPNPNKDEPWERAPGAYGFDHWLALNASNLNRHCGSFNFSRWQRVDDGEAAMTNDYHTSAVAEAAGEWWSKTEGPKFAYVCFQAPHAPFHVPPAEMLPAGYPEPANVREKYDAMLVAMDTAIGDLLSKVDMDSTYVFLLADNGTPPMALRKGDQSKIRMKGSVYQDGVHVPFIVSGPGIKTGETNALGHVVDLLGTLGEFAGAAPPTASSSDSVSLVPVLLGIRPKVRDQLVTERITIERIQRRKLRIRVIRDVAVLYQSPTSGHILKGLWTQPPTLSPLKRHERANFDLTQDPREAANLGVSSREHVEDIKAMEEIYQAYVGARPVAIETKN